MSAYRRLNRTCRTITFQHPTYAVFQTTPTNSITNGISSSDNNVSDELINSTTSCSLRANTNNEKAASNTMATCNDLNHNNNLSTNSSSDDQQVQLVNSSTSNFPSQPKHVRFPDVPYHSELLNELLMFAYTIIAAAMQFMHLYRTVWWLPESNTNQTMVNMNGEVVDDGCHAHNSKCCCFNESPLFVYFPTEFLLDWHAFNHVYCDIIRTSICLLLFNKSARTALSTTFSSNRTENHPVSGHESDCINCAIE